ENPNAKCVEIKKILNRIVSDKDDKESIYSGKRTVDIVLFEILFGSLIRTEQFDLYNNIIEENKNSNTYSVKHMLMGKGKSSVIMPLIMLKFLYCPFKDKD